MSKPVRCRIAPSPTGEPHVGTAYIALINLCFSKKHNGSFILRIEDTDQARSTVESEQAIYDSLKWLGLNWDEGPDIGGDFGPYRQSERLSLYQIYIQTLLEKGHAYRCFCTQDELSEMRKNQQTNKEPLGYFGKDSKCRKLSLKEIDEKLKKNIPYVIRMAVPIEKHTVSFRDEIRKQDISKELSEIDDQIIMKSDGFPTYHFASIVDDHLMEITHVLRGEEWINSTFKHVLLYNFFGWSPPKFYHLGLLRNPDANKSKISKRRNPVSLRWFRAAGYYNKALLNFLGLMGYSRYREDMTDEEKKNCEIFSLDTLINEFDEQRLSPTGPAFDFVKLEDINFNYIAKLSDNEFYSHIEDRLEYLKTYFQGYNNLLKERFSRTGKGIDYWTDFLFSQSINYTENNFLKASKDFKESMTILKNLKKLLSEKAEDIKSEDDIKNFMNESVTNLNVKSKVLHMLVRVAVTGNVESLPLYPAMYMLGIFRCIIRFEQAIEFLNSIKK